MGDKILIVSHDAGGAEIISAWVRKHAEDEYFFVLEGPAVNIFSRKIKNLKNNSSNTLPSLLTLCDWVLTGTSWASDLEKEVVDQAVKNKIFVVSYLDHWVNYPERFIYKQQTILPSEIWVGDVEAMKIAMMHFPKEKIVLVPNQYLLDIREKVAKTPIIERDDQSVRILYVCEPIAAHATKKYGNEKYFGHTEYELLSYFLNCLHANKNFLKNVGSVKIRCHPSEEKSKYNGILADYKDTLVAVSNNEDLLSDLMQADWVVGISSMALVVALFIGKKVFTCIPEENKQPLLPFAGIEKFYQGVCDEKCAE